MFISYSLCVLELRTKEDLYNSCCSKVSICQQVETGISEMLNPRLFFLFVCFNKEAEVFQILLCSNLRQEMI